MPIVLGSVRNVQNLAAHHDGKEQAGFECQIRAAKSGRGDTDHRKWVTVDAQLASDCLVSLLKRDCQYE